MQHYGEKEVTFKYDGGESKDSIGLKFQVTDVRNPLLAVRQVGGEGEQSRVGRKWRGELHHE